MLKPLFLSEVAAALNARLIGADVSFSAVSSDSRAIQPGQLFIALVGPNFDGHDYLAEVASKGAVAALVQREVADAPLPQLLVADTRLALGRLGALNRDAFDGQVAAVTGSSGKTSVKELLAAILRVQGPTLATRGNLNNDLGAPLTLLELAPEHQAAVIELGASRLGEIAYTVGLTRPRVAIINNAGLAHVGEFGTADEVLQYAEELALDEVQHGIAAAASPDVAARYTEAIVTYCESLRTFPLRGTMRDDVRPGLRITNYRKRAVIAFDVAGDLVSIIGVFYGGQDYESILHDDADD